MHRSTWNPLFLVVLLVLAFSGSNCGSSSSHFGGMQPFNVTGTWQLNFSAIVGESNFGDGAIDSAGVAAFFDLGGNIYQMPAISGASTFSGPFTVNSVNGAFFTGGSPVITGSAQGTVASATAIQGNFTTPSVTGTFTAAPSAQLSGGNVPLSGAYNGKFLGFSDSVSFNFGANGTFTGSDAPSPQLPGCGINGTLSQQGSSNVFDIAFSTTASNSCIAASETGIAFQSHSDYFNVNSGADATYFYAIMLTSSQSQRPYVIVIYQ
jgi:hypothetical protein